MSIATRNKHDKDNDKQSKDKQSKDDNKQNKTEQGTNKQTDRHSTCKPLSAANGRSPVCNGRRKCNAMG